MGMGWDGSDGDIDGYRWGMLGIRRVGKVKGERNVGVYPRIHPYFTSALHTAEQLFFYFLFLDLMPGLGVAGMLRSEGGRELDGVCL